MRTSMKMLPLVCAALLAGSSPAGAQADFQWHGPIPTGQRIEIKGVNGDIRAVASSTNEVEVTATRSAIRSNPADVHFEVVPNAGGVTICAVYPSAPGREPNR